MEVVRLTTIVATYSGCTIAENERERIPIEMDPSNRWHLVASVVVAMVEGDSKVKTLLCLPGLATVMPLGTVNLLEGVAIGVLVQLYFKGILQV
ncbi:Os12g0585001 [Oryza sativa Japonica Group]|uniref:Os12g0585001 protein n=1 Tax=Oryza sativa subsp. japonica TaxID=39947 RepID=A0A0P0YCA8_ORYSJ|nr:Os12g0585001 [Oryza sativa Japonica Group]